jgi:hypothetical protein
VLDAIPASWKEEITAEERSLMRAFAGELYGLQHAIDPKATGCLLANRTFLDRTLDVLVDPFFKRQDFHNRLAARYMGVARLAEGPLSDYFERFASDESISASQSLAAWLYNPLGNRLASAITDSSLSAHAALIADLEGSRRAALLAAQLRASGVAPENTEEQLQRSSLRNPYTDEPFEWDREIGAIVFNGLAEGERKRQEYLL